MPPFDPDPGYRISAEEREALSPWVSVRAAERYLAALTEEQREIALWLLGPMGGNEHNLNVQQLEPTGHPDWDRAIWDLYEDVRAHGSAGEDFPFPKPDRTSQRP